MDQASPNPPAAAANIPYETAPVLVTKVVTDKKSIDSPQKRLDKTHKLNRQ